MEGSASPYDRLQRLLIEMSHLTAASNVLQYDMETVMPEAGAEARGKTLAFLAGAIHDKLVAPESWEVMYRLKEELDRGNLDELQAAVVRSAWREFSREIRLPGCLVREMTEAEIATQNAWRKGKRDKDSGPVMPLFERLVDLKRQAAEELARTPHGRDDFFSPYNALLDIFEPGMTAERVAHEFAPLRDFLRDLVRRIGASPQKIDPGDRRITADIALQEKLNLEIAKIMGFDFNAGRLDRSTHPFTLRLHPGDTRITTRYALGDMFSSLSAAMHETGHGMYEQAMPLELFWTGAGHVPSFGIHESQSRLWENMVGRSQAFIRFLCQRMWALGILNIQDTDAFYRAVNAVQPSLIRVEADEVTYNLHVILRFELEHNLINGWLQVKDLRDAWNEKMTDYLGVEVPDDFSGFLQDTHWPSGMFGYFPTYTIGTLYSAQLFDAAKRDVPDLEEGFARGEFAPLLEWLRANVFVHAGMLPADEIIARATGYSLDVTCWMDYITRKYGAIYGL